MGVELGVGRMLSSVGVVSVAGVTLSLGVAGSVPGGSGTVVVIKPSVKAKGAK